MTNKRDDFLKSVIKQLKEYSGYRCSNPECRVVTSGGKMNIGVAAHICAAAPLGPRYDPKMTKEERRSYKNGIWLCQSCAKKIDNDVNSFTIERLNLWKTLSEEEANKAIGTRVLDEQSASDMLAMALSGFPKKFIAGTIKNSHTASNKSLEQLDPRFSVNSIYDGENTKFTLRVKETVPLKIKVKNSGDYKRDYHKLISKGESLQINIKDIDLSGSPLIDQITNNQEGIVTVSSQEIDVVMILKINNGDISMSEAVGDVQGKLSYGQKALTFRGECLSGMLKVKAVFPRKGEVTNIRISTDFDKWQGLDVLKLPYFNKLLSLYNKLTSGWGISFVVEVYGDAIYYGECNNYNENEFNKRVATLLNYTNSARILSELEGVELNFDRSVTFTSEEHKKLREAIRLLEGIEQLNISDFNSLPEFPLVANADNIKILSEGSDELSHFSIEDEDVNILTVFHRDVELYKIRQEFYNVKFDLDKHLNCIKLGETFKVKIKAGEDFMYVKKFIQ